MAVDRRQRLRLRHTARLAVCAAAAALIWVPHSTLFAMPTTNTKADKKSAATSGREAREKKFRGSDNFLKFLVSQETIYANNAIAGLVEIQKETDTNLELSRSGEYYPYSKHAKKVAILGGKQDNIMKAFRSIFKKAAGRDTVHMTFLVPTDVAKKLVDEGAIKALKAETNVAQIFVKRAPNGEEQVEVLGKKGAAFDKVAEKLLANMDVDSMKRSLRLNYQGGKRYLPTTIYLKVKNAVAGEMIGRKGSNSKALEQEFNVDLKFDEKKDGESSERTVKIKGALGDVQAIHQHLVTKYIEKAED